MHSGVSGPRKPRSGWSAFYGAAGLALAFLLTAQSPAESRGRFNSCTDPATFNGDFIFVTMPVLDFTVTTFDPGWFSSDESQNSSVLFVLTMGPKSQLDTLAGRLRLRVRVEADTSLGRNPGSKVVAFDQVTEPLAPAQFGVPLTSPQVFALTYQTGGVGFKQSELYDIVVNKHLTPEMNLRFIFELACEDGGLVAWGANSIKLSATGPSGGDAKLRYVRTVQALSPGTDVANLRPAYVYTLNPVFQIASELFNNLEFVYPPGVAKIEIFLYELQAGQNPRDAMDGMEFAKFPVPNQFPVPYPAGLPRLTPGKLYAWRARALLRGPESEYRLSNALYFQVDPRLEGDGPMPTPNVLSDLKTFQEQVKFGDDYVKRVMAALKIILGENFEIFDLSRSTKIPAKGQIRLNGRPYSMEELERLAREFHQSHHSLTRLRFQ